MRNFIRLAVAVLAATCLFVVPGAFARNDRHHHRAHHRAAHHKVHHRARHRARQQVRTRHIGSATAADDPGSSSTPAGTVTSFDGTTLVVTLADNSTVSGRVTDATEIECRTAAQQADDDQGDDQANDQNDDSGDDQSGGDDRSGDDSGDRDQSGSGNGDDDQANDQNDDRGDDHGDDDGNDDAGAQQAPACGTAALTPGAKVDDAVLRITSAGAVWKKIELEQ